MQTTMTRAAGVAVFLMLAGCGDDGDATGADSTGEATTTTTTTTAADTTGDEGTTGGDSSSGSDVPTTGAATETTTGGEPLMGADIVGTFASNSCEAYPDGMGGTNHLTRKFTLTASTWHLELDLFMDDACTTGLFSVVIDGPYTLGALSASVDGATEGEFSIATNLWTAHQSFMADTFTMAGCGSAPWVVEEAQDVATTGCIGVAHPIASCPKEFDVVALVDDQLFFGERITDLCSLEGRPAALVGYPLIRQ